MFGISNESVKAPVYVTEGVDVPPPPDEDSTSVQLAFLRAYCLPSVGASSILVVIASSLACIFTSCASWESSISSLVYASTSDHVSDCLPYCLPSLGAYSIPVWDSSSTVILTSALVLSAIVPSDTRVSTPNS